MSPVSVPNPLCRSLRRQLASLLAAVTGTAHLTPAHAQQQLPPIVVEGASIAVKPAKPKPASQGAPATVSSPAPTSGGGGNPVPSAPAATTSTPPASLDLAAAGAGQAGSEPDGIAADQLGSSISIVTGRDIAGEQVRNAADALRGLPGVSVNRTGGFAGLSQVRIRGAEANHTLVLIDGVPANQVTTGEFDFSNLPAEGIERIEVIKGPQSGLVGSNAIGGVVNVITRRGEGPVRIDMKAEGGSMGTRDLSGIVSGGNGFIHGALTLHQRITDGFNTSLTGSEKDNAHQDLVAFKGGIRPTEAFALDVMLRRTTNRGGRDDENFAGPAGTLLVQTDTPSRFEWTTLLMGAEARLDTFGGFWTHALRISRNATTYQDTIDVSGFFNVYEDHSGNDRMAYLSTFRFGTPGMASVRHTLTAMIEQERDGYTPVSRDNVERSRSRLNTALEWRGVIADALALTANVRHDDNASFEDFTTWRASASWKLPAFAPGLAARPHASVGTGVKYPTMFEQFGEFPGPIAFKPNPDLKPEESLGWDAGVEWSMLGGRLVVDLTYFAADIRNKIEGDDNFPEMPINLAGVSRHKGLESSARFAFAKDLALSLGHTYLDARNNDALTEIRRPRHSGHATLVAGFADGKGEVRLGAKYNGAMHDETFRLPFFTEQRVKLDDYWLLSLAGSYKVAPQVELYGRVENLLDETYQEVYGFASAPLAAYAGVKISLGGVKPSLTEKAGGK